MATSKGRGGATSKSAAKKATKSSGNRSGSNRGSAPSKAAASKGGKKAAAKKSTATKATKATAAKKSAPAKSASRGAAGGRGATAGARNGAASKSAASRGRSTSGGAARGGRAAAKNTSSRASSSRAAQASRDPRNDLEKILQDLMKDIYYAEKKLTKALGKMAKKTTNERLRDAFTTHQAQTDEQIQKLERAFEMIGQKPKAKKCAAMDGLVEESEEHMQEYEKGAGLDAALIVGAQKVEHYEIAAYGSMRSIAETLGYNDAARIFEEIREQESDTDELLTQIAESVVNLQAEEEVDGEEEGGATSGSSSGGRGSADSEAGEDSSSAFSGSSRGDNDGAGRGISALTDGNDRGETGEAMGY